MRFRFGLTVIGVILLFALPGSQASATRIGSSAHLFDLPGSASQPVVVKEPSGKYGLFFVEGEGSTLTIDFFQSTDGKTWSDPVPIASEQNPGYIIDLAAAASSTRTYVSYIDHHDTENDVMLTSSTNGQQWETPSKLGTAQDGDVPALTVSRPDIATTTAEPQGIGLANVAAWWVSDGKVYSSEFPDGTAPAPGKPNTSFSSLPTSSFASLNLPGGDNWSASGFGPQVSVNHNNPARTSTVLKLFTRSNIVTHVWLVPSADAYSDTDHPEKGRGRLAVYWEESDQKIYFSTIDLSKLPADTWTEPMLTEVPPQTLPSFSTGDIGDETKPQDTGPAGASGPTSVIAWLENLNNGKFQLYNAVSTDGGVTFGQKIHAGQPTMWSYGNHVAVLGHTIWNVYTDEQQFGQFNLNVAVSNDNGATYEVYPLTSDNVSYDPLPFLFAPGVDGFAFPQAAAANAQTASAPIMLAWTHFITAGGARQQISVAPLALTGDANCDNYVDAGDVVVTLRSVATGSSLPCDVGADSNCGGTIGADDALLDLKFAAHVQQTQPQSCALVGT